MNRRRLLAVMFIMIMAVISIANASAADAEFKGIPADARVSSGWTALDSTLMEYSFGRKIARNCLGIQVTVINNDPDNDLIVREITLHIGEQSEHAYDMSSLDKEVLDSLMERGQFSDPRNVLLRVLQSVGVVGVSVSTFAHVGPAYAPALAAFSGPFTNAYSSLFPDYTVKQLIRIGNAAFDSNKVVPKNSAVKLVAFVPFKLLFSKKERKTYRKNPDVFWNKMVSIKPVINSSVVKPAT